MKPLYTALKYQTMSRHIKISVVKADLRVYIKKTDKLSRQNLKSAKFNSFFFCDDRILIRVK